jgi:arylsulfatase
MTRDLIAALVLLTSGVHAAPKPNVLLILADDLGYSDLGCYGSEIATPNLDAIAENGLRFTQFYNTSRCWPTRGALLTGYYPQQIHRDALPEVAGGGGDQNRRPAWAELLPKRLREAGYRSYHTGKWHIDGKPVAEGFDHSYNLQDQGRFFNPNKHAKDDIALPPVEKDSGYYGTTALADHVIEVLKDHAANHRDAPFFHYLAFAAPHFPLQALPEDIALYQDTYTEGWDVIRAKRWQKMRQLGLLDGELSRPEADLGPPYHFPEALAVLGPGEIDKPVPWKRLTDAQRKFQAGKMAIHAAMIHRMDLEIGRVFEQIKAIGQWENTLVLFLSDNGASAEIMVRDDGHDLSLPPGSAGTYLCLGPGWSTVANTPFRRHKTWTHEGGIATPLLASWPAGIAARGEIRTTPGHVIDVVPTLLELAGARTLSDAPPAPGKSLVPVFAKDAEPLHETLWWYHEGHKAVRRGDWKAVAPKGEPWELYDLATDRDESTDLAVPQAEKLRELAAAWDRLTNEFTTLASADLAARPAPAPAKGKGKGKAGAAAEPPRKQVLINGETFALEGRPAFRMVPEKPAAGKPWVFYGPTLPVYPDEAERWMHERFLAGGIAVAGVDVGEAYGSPKAFPFFEALHQKMVADGYSAKPVLLGRSRGGLWASSWALAHPDRVAGIAGIYPVYDFTTYPGLEKSAPAYALTKTELEARQDEFNPIRRAAVLAEAKIPVFIIHGTDDQVVPLPQNSGKLEEIYETAGAGDLIEVMKIKEQGHNFWTGFFQCQELVDFVIARAGVENSALPQALHPWFSPPTDVAGDLGEFRNPLLFNDGSEVRTAADWAKRREEILRTWHGLMGEWPPLITEPVVETLESVKQENFTRHRVRFPWTPTEKTTGYLFIPDKATTGKHPAVLTVYYEPETAAGMGNEQRDFAYQLAKRGFVTLSIGTSETSASKDYALYWPSIDDATVQPLSMLAYAAANAWHILAARPEVDPARIGVTGHSYGGKWSMFASCLFEKFACAAWSDPGIVFDTRPSVNYWEPWYLGYHPKPWRERGVPSESNPARGLYPELLKQGRDLHELHALMAPRPFLVSGGSEDPPARWKALNHSIAVNRLLGLENRVAMHNRPDHTPNPESNEVIYGFFEHFLKP